MNTLRFEQFPNSFEADLIPEEGDIVCIGFRKELVVEVVPENTEHGHLVRTAYRTENQGIEEQTYVVDKRQRTEHTFTKLGSGLGPKISESYHKRLMEAGL